jgi:hypothetical protein
MKPTPDNKINAGPQMVRTDNGLVWTRRAGTRGGAALYAPEAVRDCPTWVMVTLAELAEQGVTVTVLPAPVDEVARYKELAACLPLDDPERPMVDPEERSFDRLVGGAA